MALTTVTGNIVSVNAIQGTLIADNAITAVHIATNAVSGTLIADNAVTAVHIAQNTITVTQLADDCVESDKIADGIITTNHLNKAMISSQTEVSAASGDFVLLGDTSDSNNLKKAPVSSLVGTGGITTAKIADDAVTGAKIENAVTIATSVTSPLVDGQNFKVNGGQGSDGQVLTSTGSGVAWEDAAGGTAGISSSADATAITIDSSEKIGMPTVASTNPVAASAPKLGINGANAQDAQLMIHRHKANGLGPYFVLAKSRSDTNDKTVIQDGDHLGTISFQGADGSNFQQGAQIQAQVDGTPGSADMPGRLLFLTTADGANTPTERMRINNAGHVVPGANNTYDLGATATRWRNIYTNDLQLSNEGGDSNEIDGTTGSWTIQEGSDNLFIINRNTGKKYKFLLEEV